MQANTQQQWTSKQLLDLYLEQLKLVVASRCITSQEEAAIVTAMEFWGVDLTYHATPERLVNMLLGTLPKDPWIDPRDADIAYGLSWFNPLTEAEVILTMGFGFRVSLADHDGEGEDLIPWWWSDEVSNSDTSAHKLYKTLVNYFVSYCMDQQTLYTKRLQQQEGYISPESFKTMVGDLITQLHHEREGC